ncbi:MAG TPA: GntR family transcriptional regulator [Lacipirellulaceae bacterium]|jgi:GntR family transcriptional regulator|nr:GntR family transcriptional regulator [Lacipirellulaceae bacterium]
MFLRIEKGSAIPISRQIADQIATLCASGSVKPGDRLPSVRELARDLAVNQNTVLRVYERLCADGLLETRHGQGTFATGRTSKTRTAAHRARLVDELRQIAQQASGLGLSIDELHELLAEATNGVAAHRPVAVSEDTNP